MTLSEEKLHTETEPPSLRVLAIFTSPAKGEPMVQHESVTAVAGGGIKGDRYPNEGFYSDKRIPNEQRGITLISSQGIEQANAELMKKGIKPFSWKETRRNVVVDIDPDELNELLHRKFTIGGIEVEGADPCTPCTRPGELTERPIKEQQVFIKAFLKRGGLRVKVLRGGPLSNGSLLGYPK